MKVTLKQIRLVLVIAALMLLSGGYGWNLGQQKKAVSVLGKADLNLFWQVWQQLETKYLDKDQLKPKEMVWGAIKGMTAALGDPYTVFLPPEDNKESKEELNGAFEGVGIELGFKDEILAVVAPLAGMPAEAAGIKAGDYILHIKDEAKKIDQDTVGLSLPEAVKIIRGPKNTPVIITVLTKGDSEPRELTIRRDTIVIKSVELKWLDNNQVAHLRLTRFGGRTDDEWDKAISEIMKNRQLKGLILDLRNNPGGYLQGAIDYAAEFLPAGRLIVKQKEADGQEESYSAKAGGRLLTIPLLVLINQGSASSSEILAGALRDNQRAKLVGDKSFGKGTVQEALELGNGAGLHVTTAKWLLPSGEWVNETKGLTPEIVISDDPKTETDEQLTKALEAFNL